MVLSANILVLDEAPLDVSYFSASAHFCRKSKLVYDGILQVAIHIDSLSCV